MWGNALGWKISAAIVIVVVGFLFMLARTDTLSPPTAFSTGSVMEPLPPIPGVADVLPMTDDPDAATTYAKAIASYQKNRRAYESFANSVKTDAGAIAPLKEGLDALRAGTRMSKLTLFTSKPDTVIRYDTSTGDAGALAAVGRAAARLGFLLKDDKPREALVWLDAAFGCGAKMYDERVTYGECFAGLELMSASAGYIAKVSDKLGDKDRAEAARKFDQARKDVYATSIEPVVGAINVIDPGKLGRYVGDYFVVAESSQERMWRVAAIRTLGIVRKADFVGKRRGDELGATRAARRYAKDPDPVIAAAGKAAAELRSVNEVHFMD
jgi:hypothetical protein